MREILIKIANILWKIPNMTKEKVILVINPLDTEKQAQMMLKYLKNNKQEKNIEKIKRKSLEISGKIIK